LNKCLSSKIRCVFESHRAYIMFHDETTDDLKQFMDKHMNFKNTIRNENKKEIAAFLKESNPKKKRTNDSAAESEPTSSQTETASAISDSIPSDDDESELSIVQDNQLITVDNNSSLPSMNDYHVIRNNEDDTNCTTAIKHINEYIAKCKSSKAIKKLNVQIETHLAYVRTDQYGRKFDKCDTMVRPKAAVRCTNEGHCSCNQDKYKAVIHAGCSKCCISFPLDTRCCKCHGREYAFTGCNDMGGCFPHGGCMHPGDWNSDNIAFCKDVFSLCLVCGTFDKCEHGPIHQDVIYIVNNFNSTSTDLERLEPILEGILDADKGWYTLETQVAEIQKEEDDRQERKRRHEDAGGVAGPSGKCVRTN
jgi:hypothetical protein